MPVTSPIQIFPQDLNPNKAIGVDIPFNKPGVFTPNYQTKDAIKYNLINYFLTNTGERFMNPEFGGGLRDFIFEQISLDNLSDIKENFQDKINEKFSRIIIQELDVISVEDENLITILMKYSLENTNIVDSITIDFNR